MSLCNPRASADVLSTCTHVHDGDCGDDRRIRMSVHPWLRDRYRAMYSGAHGYALQGGDKHSEPRQGCTRISPPSG